MRRTTVTLDADTEQMIRRRMREQKTSFKQALNDAIREGCRKTADKPFETAVASMGRPVVNLDRALQIAAELEDEALIARLRAGS
jgi:hypothetical protein